MSVETGVDTGEQPFDLVAKALADRTVSRRRVIKLTAGAVVVAAAGGALPQWAFAKKVKHCPHDCSHNVCGDDPKLTCMSNSDCRCMQVFSHSAHAKHCECVEDICPKVIKAAGEFDSCDAHGGAHQCPPGSVCVYPHCCPEVGSFCAPLCEGPGSTSTTFTGTPSDARLKESVALFPDALARLKTLSLA